MLGKLPKPGFIMFQTALDQDAETVIMRRLDFNPRLRGDSWFVISGSGRDVASLQIGGPTCESV